MRSTTSTPGIWTQQREMPERRPERGGLDRDVRVRVEQGVAEGRLEAGRSSPLIGCPRRRGELVELVEQARDLVGAVGIEVDGVIGPMAQEQEAELLGRHDLGDRVGGRAATLRGRHLLAADVEELVRDVQRRFALEHLAGDRLAIGRVSRRPWPGPCRSVRS